jgi:uncharacterized membrane protein
MTGLAAVGLGLAGYLTYVHYAGIAPACTAGVSCLKVQTSAWSELAGVPVALLGLIGYAGILASLAAPDGEEARLATLALTLVGAGFSGYLTYRELFSIHAICEWCVASAVTLCLLLGLALARYLGGAATASPGRSDPRARAGSEATPKPPPPTRGVHGR